MSVKDACLIHAYVNLTEAAPTQKNTANAFLLLSGTGHVVAGNCFLLRSLE